MDPNVTFSPKCVQALLRSACILTWLLVYCRLTRDSSPQIWWCGSSTVRCSSLCSPSEIWAASRNEFRTNRQLSYGSIAMERFWETLKAGLAASCRHDVLSIPAKLLFCLRISSFVNGEVERGPFPSLLPLLLPHFSFFFTILGLETKASYMLDNYSPTEVHCSLQISCRFFIFLNKIIV